MKGNGRHFYVTGGTVLTLIHTLALMATVILFIISETSQNENIMLACGMCWSGSVLILAFAIGLNKLNSSILGIEVTVEVAILAVILLLLAFGIELETLNEYFRAFGLSSGVALGGILAGVIIGRFARYAK